ncbi:alpha/beta fold hydrolase [Actinoplanes sp. NPDC049599]|uniref:alpha/beta fold hydrolase n=1 Tax=Actinoplanes sp. NPDC049599 TaxID=3363903 RepID=UPI00379FFAC9
MASWQMKGVAAFVRVAYKHRYATEAGGRAVLAKPKGPSAPPPGIRKRCVVAHRQVNGRDVYVVRSRRAAVGPSEHSVIYLHGGAYTSEIVKEHWALIAHLAERAGHDVHVPIYGLAPQHHALEALDLITKLITDQTAEGRRCYLAGDSAGGGLALLAAQAVAADPGRPVAGLTLIAPWLDLTMSNPEIPAVERTDPWLTRAGLHPIAAAWADTIPRTDPRLSPLYGPLKDLPPLHLLVGTRDITLPDCRALRDRLHPETPLEYHEEPEAIHDYPLLPVPEARPAREAIIKHIKKTLT